MAGVEHNREQKPGKSWISSYILDEIDRVLLMNNPEKRQILTKKYLGLIIAPLVLKDIPCGTINRLSIKFVSPEEYHQPDSTKQDDLTQIRKILTEEFGPEVMRRMDLSIDEEKVRSIPVN